MHIVLNLLTFFLFLYNKVVNVDATIYEDD